MKTRDLLFFALAGMVGYWLWKEGVFSGLPVLGDIFPPAKPIVGGRENEPLAGSPISNARSAEVFGAPLPPISTAKPNNWKTISGMAYGAGWKKGAEFVNLNSPSLRGKGEWRLV